jgi:hypothetical protein
MPSGPPPICLTCEHLQVMNPDEPWLCAAYPDGDGVPEDIVLGSPHLEVRPGRHRRVPARRRARRRARADQ